MRIKEKACIATGPATGSGLAIAKRYIAYLFAGFRSNALTGPSVVASLGWFMN
ncbi:hypothetical protein ACEN2J_14205 [Pseudorhodobacter sp. W20_MBD10_FR17]|uniref:hypothetical protein n=1 Tax=Pseudorhodobacter sp. W20_MBD10_FR17 TaxID=3240266 RepID=UPI003F954BE2